MSEHVWTTPFQKQKKKILILPLLLRISRSPAKCMSPQRDPPQSWPIVHMGFFEPCWNPCLKKRFSLMKTAERSRNFRPAAIIVQYDVTIFYRSETISEAKRFGVPFCNVKPGRSRSGMIFSTRFEVGCAFSELRTSDEERHDRHGWQLAVYTSVFLTRAEPQGGKKSSRKNTWLRSERNQSKSIHNFVLNPSGSYWIMSDMSAQSTHHREAEISNCSKNWSSEQLYIQPWTCPAHQRKLGMHQVGNGGPRRLSGDLPRNQMPGW